MAGERHGRGMGTACYVCIGFNALVLLIYGSDQFQSQTGY